MVKGSKPKERVLTMIRAATLTEPAPPGGPEGKDYVPTTLRLAVCLRVSWFLYLFLADPGPSSPPRPSHSQGVRLSSSSVTAVRRGEERGYCHRVTSHAHLTYHASLLHTLTVS
ncbi:hypothetical protein ROHU_017910 [Labeo rohita]|uniref:Uncharacterized protein n=1 Tax=Labeo rohita TaxID=84645 RepID=A0A498ND89_LABRO|nr:hypothetical protein ROHU_033966 [Labeo rohita]RXN30174.1 hypothetical protein ROHU_017910 [Labeo rohita]